MNDTRTSTTRAVLDEVSAERARQDAKWGEQNHPAFKHGEVTYRDILLEEVFEALAESNQARLRAELVQVAAVAVAWVEKIDRHAVAGSAS